MDLKMDFFVFACSFFWSADWAAKRWHGTGAHIQAQLRRLRCYRDCTAGAPQARWVALSLSHTHTHTHAHVRRRKQTQSPPLVPNHRICDVFARAALIVDRGNTKPVHGQRVQSDAALWLPLLARRHIHPWFPQRFVLGISLCYIIYLFFYLSFYLSLFTCLCLCLWNASFYVSLCVLTVCFVSLGFFCLNYKYSVVFKTFFLSVCVYECACARIYMCVSVYVYVCVCVCMFLNLFVCRGGCGARSVPVLDQYQLRGPQRQCAGVLCGRICRAAVRQPDRRSLLLVVVILVNKNKNVNA